MANPPSTVTYARVVWQAVQFVADSADAGLNPDQVAQSGTIVFTPDAVRVPFPNALPNPLTAWQRSITCTLDSEGYLVDPQGVRGVSLVASNSPSEVGDFTYSVTISLVGGDSVSFSAYFPAETETDLTLVIPAPPNPGHSSSYGTLVPDPDHPGYFFFVGV